MIANTDGFPDGQPVPLLDLKPQYASLRKELETALLRVAESQSFILGPEVEAFEQEAAAYLNVSHAIGVSSGTDALLMALMALDIGPGDEVVTSPFTFFATAGCIHRVGARPVFADILPDTFCLNPAAAAAAVTDNTKALLPVHLFGHTAPMDPLLDLAAAHGLSIIEDAAQAIGTEYKGRRVGALGDIGCFSFFPSKNLGGFGDGGLVTTQHEHLASKLRKLRNHGMEPKYHHAIVGGNFRLDALQAAILRVKLPHLDQWTDARFHNARIYCEEFERLGLRKAGVVVPCHTGHCPKGACANTRHTFNQFTIRVPRRDALREHLASHRIGCEIYYPIPLHLQQCFAHLGYREGDFPEAERACREVLSLPVYPELTEAQILHVARTIAEFYGLATT